MKIFKLENMSSTWHLEKLYKMVIYTIRVLRIKLPVKRKSILALNSNQDFPSPKCACRQNFKLLNF